MIFSNSKSLSLALLFVMKFPTFERFVPFLSNSLVSWAWFAPCSLLHLVLVTNSWPSRSPAISCPSEAPGSVASGRLPLRAHVSYSRPSRFPFLLRFPSPPLDARPPNPSNLNRARKKIPSGKVSMSSLFGVCKSPPPPFRSLHRLGSCFLERSGFRA